MYNHKKPGTGGAAPGTCMVIKTDQGNDTELLNQNCTKV